jgi:hypothetical protein
VTIYVDDAGIVWRGKRRYHLTADSKEELHAFAARIGVKRCWYHRGRTHPHYDLTGEQRGRAVSEGACEVGSRELLTRAKQLVPR